MSDASTPPPWTVGDEGERWNGYLDYNHVDTDVGMPIMANKLGATTYKELRYVEDAFAGAHMAVLAEKGLPATYDLDGLCSIHRELFGEVYEWAGELRTVPLQKGGSHRPFARVSAIPEIWEGISEVIAGSDRLAAVPEAKYAQVVASLYAAMNEAHPFREGNGRTQRLFLSALAEETGHYIAWDAITGADNDYACQLASTGDLVPLVELMQQAITTEAPARQTLDFPDAPSSQSRHQEVTRAIAHPTATADYGR